MQKCTRMNNEHSTPFKVFSVGLLCFYGIYRTERRHSMLFKQQCRHRYRRNGASSVYFVFDVDDVKGPKSEHQLTICQCIHLQSFLTALESIKLFSSKFDFYSSCFQGALLWVNEVMHTPSGIRNRQIGFTCCSLAFRYCFHVTGSVTPQTFITKPTYNTPKCLLRLFFP